MFNAICRECDDQEFSYDITAQVVNIYPNDLCHHIELECPRRHIIRLHINISWLAQAQAKVAPRQIRSKYHDTTPAAILEFAKRTWEVHHWTNEIRASVDRFGETGLIL